MSAQHRYTHTAFFVVAMITSGSKSQDAPICKTALSRKHKQGCVIDTCHTVHSFLTNLITISRTVTTAQCDHNFLARDSALSGALDC